MNRSEKRDLQRRAIDRIKGSKGWVVVTLNKGCPPVYQYDVSALKDESALSHQAMHEIAYNVARICEQVFDAGKVEEGAELPAKLVHFEAFEDFLQSSTKDASAVNNTEPSRTFGDAQMTQQDQGVGGANCE